MQRLTTDSPELLFHVEIKSGELSGYPFNILFLKGTGHFP